MINNLKLAQKWLLLISIPLIFEVIFIVTLSYCLEKAEVQTRAAETSKAIIAQTGIMGKLFYEAAFSLVDYKLSHSEAWLKKHRAICHQIERQLDLIGNLTKNQTDQRESYERLRTSVSAGLNVFRDAQETIDSGQLADALTYSQMMLCSNRLLAAIDQVSDIERKRESFGPNTDDHYKDLTKRLLLGGFVLNTALAILLGIFLNEGMKRRLGILLENLTRFSKGEALLPPMSGTDEIANLDSAFRNMAQALNEARHNEKAIMENANDVICSLDSNLTLKTINSASFQNWGYLPDEIIGLGILDLLVAGNRQELGQRLANIVKTKENGTFESKIIHKSGKLIDVWWSVRWSEAQQALFCIVHDNSERKEAERIKQDIMKMVSHDLRSPLTSIQFSLDILGSGARGRMSEDGLRDIAIAKKNINQLMKLVNYLLDVEKLASGTLKLNTEQISVDFLINRSVESIVSWALDRNIEINYPHTGLFIVGDFELLSQVLINFLSNAIKVSPENGKINIQALSENSMLVIKVTDQGPGIPADKQGEIFKPFQQLNSAANVKTPSTGLGLSICKMIVDLHKGKIGVNSEVGVGSTFWFGIPLKAFFDL